MLANYSIQSSETDMYDIMHKSNMSRYKLLATPTPVIQEKKAIIGPPSDEFIIGLCIIVIFLYICTLFTKVVKNDKVVRNPPRLAR